MATLPSSENNIVAAHTSSISGQYLSERDEQSVQSQSLSVSNQTASVIINNISDLYGVDWSNRATPTSHCWFPAMSNDSSNGQTCMYVSCGKLKPADSSPLLKCGSCELLIHSHHLNNSHASSGDILPPCRPSFIDRKNYPSQDDEHCWSNVPVLSEPCSYCRRQSMSKNVFSDIGDRLLTLSTMDIIDEVTSIINPKTGSSSPKSSKSSTNFVCLWCQRGYHQVCLEKIVAEHGKGQCDYGIFRNVIVRPQWLSRCSESPAGFKARLPLQSDGKECNSNTFPYTPVLAFINKRSGGQVGEGIYRELIRKLNPRQVFLLENNDTITRALDIYASLPNVRIFVLGGDGTVGWVLGRLAEAYPSKNNPPVSICPLGTGNDLSRVLTWGEQYDSKRLLQTLLDISQAEVVALDRWEVQLEQLDATTSSSPTEEKRDKGFKISSFFQHFPKFVRESNRAAFEHHQRLPNTRFINYMSFGLDAAIALEFHDERVRDPSKFSSPLKNKLMYVNESCKYLKDFARANMWDLSSYIRLICDDQDLTDSMRDCHTVVVLNIPGYASGTNPWGTSSSASTMQSTVSQLSMFQKKSESNLVDAPELLFDSQQSSCVDHIGNTSNHFQRQDFGDRKIEIVGLSTAHMAAIHVGMCGRRIAQCSRLRVELCSPMTAQMDGEPFYLPAAVAVNISHAGQVLVSKNTSK